MPIRGATDHNRIAARFLKHAAGILRGLDIPVADERDIIEAPGEKRFFDLPDDAPVGLAAETLGREPSMDGDRFHPEIGGGFGETNSRNVAAVPAASHLDRNRDFRNCINHGFDNGFRLTQVFQKRRSRAGFRDLRDPAAHVYIDAIASLLHYYPSGFRHRIRVAAKELAKHGAFFVRPVEHAESLLVFIMDRV
ncbi:MAG: hypothetical protein V4671_09240 [Armatimonadota bacterium]